jgi:hypothetical protein
VTETSTSDRSTWASDLDRSTDEQVGDLVVIEVLDTTYGDGEEAERVPSAYASYANARRIGGRQHHHRHLCRGLVLMRSRHLKLGHGGRLDMYRQC